MLPFRSEIRNSPKEQTIKIYVKDTSASDEIKSWIEKLETVRIVEIQDSVSRNRVEENITVYRKEGSDINELKEEIDNLLSSFFQTEA